MSEVEEPQREITRLALRSLDGTSFVLAGSGAIREHGLVDRPTEDVDPRPTSTCRAFLRLSTPLCLDSARPATTSQSYAASTNSLG